MASAHGTQCVQRPACLGAHAQIFVFTRHQTPVASQFPAGPITNHQLESIFLFPDEARIMVFPITGARLREVLERGVSCSASPVAVTKTFTGRCDRRRLRRPTREGDGLDEASATLWG